MVDPRAVVGTPQPILVDGSLALRPWRVSDVGSLVTAYADPAIRHWHTRTMDADEARAWVASEQAAWQEARRASWAVEQETLFAGRMTLRLNLAGGTAEAAYWTVPTARGRGVAPRALEAAVAWAFRTGFHRVELQHSTRNEPSCRVALSVGFAAEGTRRAAGLHADGWHDMHLHGRVGP